MQSKITVTLKTTLLLVLLAFSGLAAAKDRDYPDGSGRLYRFISMEQVEVSRGKTITQILTYVGFNGNLDYWLMVFVNPKNEEISMHSGVDVDLNFTKGDKVKVIWELTTLYEAALGDEPYYFWSIVEIENRELSQPNN